MSLPRSFPTPALALALALAAPLACSAAGGSESAWTGSIDTLPSGVVAVSNRDVPVWNDATAWRITEDLRIGTLEGDGPDLFGRINDIAVDQAGRIWVLEGQAQEIRVFDAAGRHVRTVGRKGGGPGEFAQALALQWAPDGTLWIPDPQNNRIAVVDTAGDYVGGKPSPGGFVIMPWPGGFVEGGWYFSPLPLPGDETFRMGLVRYDTTLTPVDTVAPPAPFGSGPRFELRRGDNIMIASVPFAPGLEWTLHPSGTFWALHTGEYLLFQLSLAGDTLRTVTRDFTPLAVTASDIEEAIEDLEWFTRQGGKIDRSKFPPVKPATDRFYVDDQGYLWVELVTDEPEDTVFDVLDPEGRYLGTVRIPFPVSRRPVFRDGMLYAVTLDALDVAYVVRARIEKP